MDSAYNESVYTPKHPKLLVCIITLNSAHTVTYALESVLSDGYPLDRIKVLVVDGGSTDGTVEVVRKVLQESGVDYEVLVTGDNIPEARNRCIDEAVTSGFDYLLFVDSDVVTSLRNLINCLIEKEREHHPAIIQASPKPKFFRDAQELSEFSRKVLASRAPAECRALTVRPLKYVGMGFTLIPANALRALRFDPDLTFREDRAYCMRAWLSNVKVLRLTSDGRGELAYDVNVTGVNDIYVNTSFTRHFKGLWKKVVALAYTYYDGSMLKAIINLLRDRYGRRVTAYALLLYSFIGEFATTLTVHLRTVLRADELLALLSLTGFTAACTALHRSVRSLRKALGTAVKFMLFSAAQLLLLPAALLRYGKVFKEVLRKRKTVGRSGNGTHYLRGVRPQAHGP